MRIPRALVIPVLGALLAAICTPVYAQAALLLQDADGPAKVFSPLGHEAVYFARICAASPTKLRRCAPGELGVVISRYRGIAGYDWLAMPLIPYLYSVENTAQVPQRIDSEGVQQLRAEYHDKHLISLGANVPEGGGAHRGWDQLVGAAYERRIYAFRFETTEAQDNAFIARMNSRTNHSHFNILFNNCANFSAAVMNFYFPGQFGRRILPDFGIMTPREVAYQLARYARKHPQVHLAVLEIPLVPGHHQSSRVGRGVTGSLLITGYVVPIAVLSPYVAGAVIADCLVWGRYPLPLDHAETLAPQDIGALASSSPPGAAGLRAPQGLATRASGEELPQFLE